MKKKTLTHAPLVHAVLHLRFSETPSLNPMSREVMKSLHLRMINNGFPEKIESQANMIDMVFDPVLQQMTHSQTQKKRVLFRAAGEKDIVEISEDSIILKTTNYVAFDTFYPTFHGVLKACLEVLDGLELTLLKSVGLRYVDVIVPQNGVPLKEYVVTDVLPPSLQIIEGAKHIQGATLKVIETRPGQVLVVNFEELKSIDNKVSKVLPDNLIEPDPKCGLQIAGQESWIKVTSETYGLLDVDHTHTFVSSPKFNVENIEKAAQELYQHASDVFWNVVSDFAKKEWGLVEKNVE